jgi:hypothetical protein
MRRGEGRKWKEENKKRERGTSYPVHNQLAALFKQLIATSEKN